MSDSAAEFLADIRRVLEGAKASADAALQQVPPARLHDRLGPESNSIVVVMRHLGGSMRSRWTDFRTTDGEKPNRNRDAEFHEEGANPDEAFATWEEGWHILFAALDSLLPAEWERVIRIRGEPHTVRQALLRQTYHASYHVGQIVLLARHAAGENWNTLTIPRGLSDAFREAMRAKFEGGGNDAKA